MSFFRCKQTSELLSGEPMLLGKYIYTLAIVVQAAYGLPVSAEKFFILLKICFTGWNIFQSYKGDF